VAALKFTVTEDVDFSSALFCLWFLCAVTLAGIAIAFTTAIYLAEGKKKRAVESARQVRQIKDELVEMLQMRKADEKVNRRLRAMRT